MKQQKILNFYESLQYIIWVILTILFVLAIEGDLIINVVGGLIIMITMLLVIPYSLSNAIRLGVFGSPCKWGLHKLETIGYNLKYKKCVKMTLKND